jgi:ABC-type transporter Mla subunit MlaD
MRSHATDASPTPAIDLAPLNRSLEALRATVAEKWSQAADGTAADRGDAGGLSVQLGEGLKALREDLSRAITAVHSGSMAEKVGSLSHEMEMLHSTLATLKDVAARQRDYLRGVEEMLVARAREGTVELELTQEMLTNERAFLDRFHQVLSSARQEPDAVTDDPSPGEAGHGDDAAGEQTTEPR